MKPSLFIMVDGADGSGKSTMINHWKERLAAEGNAIFDLREYWKEHGTHPEYSELRSYDFIFSCEPTYAEIGRTIRGELIKNGTNYPPLAVAEAYSLDRLVLYNKLLIPAQNEGKCIIQDRGVSTSLCYQPLTSPEVTVAGVQELPGNALALHHRPDHLVLLTISPEAALARLSARYEKQDNVIFEKLDFQKRAAERFVSPEFAALFTSRGTQVHYLPAIDELAIMKEKSWQLLRQLLS